MTDNPLLDRENCYYAINGDIFRLPLILEKGVSLSDRDSRIPQNVYYNPNNLVSVIISPQFCDGLYTLGGDSSDGITFVCKEYYYRSSQAELSGLPFYANTSSIEPENITGIILPNELFKTPIKEFKTFFCTDDCLEEKCKSFMKYMRDECGYESPECNVLLRIVKARDKKTNKDNQEHYRHVLAKNIYKYLQKAVDKKLGKTDATFADIVKHYTDGTKLKLYNREQLLKAAQKVPPVRNRNVHNVGVSPVLQRIGYIIPSER